MHTTSAGVEWKTLNAAQKQLRRDMMPLYGTPRALLQLRAGSTLRGQEQEQQGTQVQDVWAANAAV